MRNIKKVIIPIIILFISFVIFLQLDIPLSRSFITNFKKIFNIQLSCQGLYVAPVSGNGNIDDEKKAMYFDSLCKQKNASEGCILNAFVENKSDHKAAISEANIVIDKIKKVSLSEVKLLGSLRNNQIACHVVNNGDKAWKNIYVQLYGYYNEKSGYQMLDDATMAKILNISEKELMIKTEALEPGEILNIKNFNVNREELDALPGTLNIGYKSFGKDKKTEIDRGLLGVMTADLSGIQFSVGDQTAPEPVKGGVILDVEKSSMQRISVDKSFGIEPRKQMLLQRIIYPTQSCEIEAYLELTTANGKTKKTDTTMQKIFVPKYKTDYGLYTEVRNWIAANNIVNYKYNENTDLQAGILYQVVILE